MSLYPPFEPQAIVDAIRSVVGGAAQVPLHQPVLTAFDYRAVNDCLLYDPVGYRFVDKFEQRLTEITGALAVATVNGTAALHLALLCAGVRPGDEVLIPALTFAASAAAIKYCGATPHFIDSSVTNFGVMPYKLHRYIASRFKLRTDERGTHIYSRKTDAKLAAILAVDLLGLPGGMDSICEVAAEFAVPVVEDAAQALGTIDHGKPAGSFGIAAALSFNANKIVTTGGGGALLTTNADFAAKARHLATTAKLRHAWEYRHDAVGYNYRMPNMNAALGLRQLQRLEETITKKRTLSERYRAALRPMIEAGQLSMLDEQPGWRWNAWLTPILLPPSLETKKKRDALLNALHAAGIQARAMFDPLHTLSPYMLSPRSDLTVATYLAERIICLPGGVGLAPQD